MECVSLFGLNIANVTMQQACDIVVEYAKDRSKNRCVFTPNSQLVLKAINDSSFHSVLFSGDLLIPDGMPLVWASKVFKTPLKEKVSGSTFFQECCRNLSETDGKVVLLGGRDGIGEKVSKNMRSKFPKLNIISCISPPFEFENNETENSKVIKLLKQTEADVLFVAMSIGRGERWIVNNKDKYNIPVSIQVGAAFDFAAGIKKIPPEFIKKIGFAWLWRLAHEPKRLWRRYLLEDSQIFYHIAREKIKNKK